MCGRYTLLVQLQALLKAFAIPPEDVGTIGPLPRYNQAPTDLRPNGLPVIRSAPLVCLHGGRPYLQEMIWRLIPRWNHGDFARYNTINAKAETVAESRMYQGPWQDSQRCLVPATGVIEWQARTTGAKQPYHLQMNGGGLFAMGGLWEASSHRSGYTEHSFTILTTAANADFAPVHDRMPVIIAAEHYDTWLHGTPAEAAELCRPFPDQHMRATPVSRAINNPNASDPALLEEHQAQAADASGVLQNHAPDTAKRSRHNENPSSGNDDSQQVLF